MSESKEKYRVVLLEAQTGAKHMDFYTWDGAIAFSNMMKAEGIKNTIESINQEDDNE